MLLRSAFIATLILAAALPAAAEPYEPGQDPATPQPQSVLHTNILVLAPDPLGDVLNARGPDPHAGDFARYAAYAAIGNCDGEQIISAQLRPFGVTQDQLRDLADRAALHTGSIPRAVRTD